MNIPGFSAEASLYKENDCYLMTVNFAQREGIIAPAQFGEVPSPDRLDFPDIPGIPQILIPHLSHRLCFYPCRPICFGGGRWNRLCFYPCRQICVWI
jgi:hypothetical protein